MKIKCKLELRGEIFERMYVCFFVACKKTLMPSCRPLIGLYGCFLKGSYGGQLLTVNLPLVIFQKPIMGSLLNKCLDYRRTLRITCMLKGMGGNGMIHHWN